MGNGDYAMERLAQFAREFQFRPGIILGGEIHQIVKDFAGGIEDYNQCEHCSLRNYCTEVQNRWGDQIMPCNALMGIEGHHFELYK